MCARASEQACMHECASMYVKDHVCMHACEYVCVRSCLYA